MKTVIRKLVLLAGILAAGSLFAETAVVDVRHAPAGLLAQRLAPLLRADERASAYHDRLILAASPERLAELRGLVSTLDTPPRPLLIEVRTRAASAQQGSDPAGGWHYRSSASRASSQQVQTMSGRPAWIRSGESMPMHRIQTMVVNGRPVQRHRTFFRDTMRGFYALPRVEGEQVTVDILQRADRPMHAAGGAAMRSTGASVSGRFGEWLQVSGEGSGTGHTASTASRDERVIELRVTPLN